MLIGFLIGLILAVVLLVPASVLAARRSADRARLSQHSVLQVERQAELTSLTGGLAHEIKNPLATLRLNLQLLAEEWAGADPAGLDDLKRRSANRLASLQREIDRLDDILEDFRRYAGQHELHVARVNLNQVVQDLLDFFSPQASAGHIRLRPGLAPGPLAVRIDVDLFKQALLNLLINARQAMEQTGSGELIVRTQRLDGRAALEVADTGPGIPPDRLEKIFQAYFSTKRHGTGLGLAITRRIVAELGGAIEVHSEVGRGSSFIIRLPLAEAEG